MFSIARWDQQGTVDLAFLASYIAMGESAVQRTAVRVEVCTAVQSTRRMPIIYDHVGRHCAHIPYHRDDRYLN